MNSVERTFEFEDRHLVASSKRSGDLSSLVRDRYDYVLLGSSWDQRCLTLVGSSVRSGVTQLFLPVNKGTSGLRPKHDETLISWCNAVSETSLHVVEHTEDLEGGLRAIEEAITSLRKQVNRPLRVLVDLSAMARYFTLAAVALCLNDSVAEFVDVLYAEGHYGEVLGQWRAEPETGVSEAVAIPALEGDWYPTRARHFIVSVGFEASKVARLTERSDPDKVSILFPHPSVQAAYERQTRKANQGWIKRFEAEGESPVINAHASDAISAWKAVSESHLLNETEDNVYCLLAGSKPHSLALALYALARQLPAVHYVRPTTHVERDIRPSGLFWTYRLRDRTLLDASSVPAIGLG
jgi:hypothetical protein